MKTKPVKDNATRSLVRELFAAGKSDNEMAEETGKSVYAIFRYRKEMRLLRHSNGKQRYPNALDVEDNAFNLACRARERLPEFSVTGSSMDW